MTADDRNHTVARLRHALADSRHLSVAYPFLARHGFMETTPNGFKAIDPETAVRRINELILVLGSARRPSKALTV